MILMPITLINILCGILLTSLTGAIFTLLFVVAGKALERMGFLHIRYELLKVAVFFYLCPVAYLSLKVFEVEVGKGKLFNPTPLITRISFISIWIWCVCVILGIGWLCYDLYRLKRRYREVFDCKLWVQELFTQIKKDLEVPEKVKICQSYRAKVPCMVGITRPKLILPVEAFGVTELRMILLHELTHYKQRDILLKRITFFALIFHFFNPFAWYLFFQVQKQSEYVCDYRVIRCTGDIQGYVNSLMLVADGDKWFSVLTSQLFVRKHDLVERVKKMKETSKVKIRSKWSVALVLAIVILTSNMSVFAASQAGAETYMGYYDETREGNSENIQIPVENEEMTGYATDSKVVTIMGDTEQLTREVTGLDWTVGSGVKLCSAYFSCEQGDEVTVTFNIDPEDVYVRVGIERADGYMRYVYNKDSIYHRFAITEPGIWRVFVENTSSVTVTAEGSIVR